MDNKLALTTAVTLVYRESMTGEDGGVSVELVRSLLDLVKVSDANIGTDPESNSVKNLKVTLSDMLNQSDISVYEASDLLTRIRINLKDDDKWYSAIEKSINAKLDEMAIHKSINVLRGKIKAMINREKVSKILREKAAQWSFKYTEIENPDKFIQELCSDLESTVSMAGNKDTAIHDEMNFDAFDTVLDVAKKVEAIEDGS